MGNSLIYCMKRNTKEIVYDEESEINNVYDIPNEYEIEKVKKLQSVFRAVSYRRRFEMIKSEMHANNEFLTNDSEDEDNDPDIKVKAKENANLNLDTKSTPEEFEEKLCPGIPITQEELQKMQLNENVYQAESKLTKFILDEKEILKYLKQYNCELRKFQLRYKNGSIYVGYMDGNWQREGYGILLLNDGSKYEGTFKNNKFFGKGRLIKSIGEYYEGEFKNNKANGFGKLVKKNGAIYVGYWKNDKQQGKGEEIFPDGSRYEGSFFIGNKNGYGKISWLDGSSYEGEFRNNYFEGKGTYRWKDGRIYTGEWKDKKMEGIGYFEWPDKKKYFGQYFNDMKNGFGIYICNSNKYEGEWRNGKQNGYGIITDEHEVRFAFFKKGREEYPLDLNENHAIFENLNLEIDKLKQHEGYAKSGIPKDRKLSFVCEVCKRSDKSLVKG